MRAWAIAFLAGRGILAGFLLYNAFNHFANLQVLAEFAAVAGVPFPELAVVGTGLLLALGGACVLTGAYPRVGLTALVLFFVGVTPVMHNFWDYADPMLRTFQLGHFLKNSAILGGVLALYGVPEPWAYSFAGRWPRGEARQPKPA